MMIKDTLKQSQLRKQTSFEIGCILHDNTITVFFWQYQLV